MRNNIMVSVIVPVYNGEGFLRRAIESVQCQRYGQLILINGNSSIICDEYAAKLRNTLRIGL